MLWYSCKAQGCFRYSGLKIQSIKLFAGQVSQGKEGDRLCEHTIFSGAVYSPWPDLGSTAAEWGGTKQTRSLPHAKGHSNGLLAGSSTTRPWKQTENTEVTRVSRVWTGTTARTCQFGKDKSGPGEHLLRSSKAQKQNSGRKLQRTLCSRTHPRAGNVPDDLNCPFHSWPHRPLQHNVNS